MCVNKLDNAKLLYKCIKGFNEMKSLFYTLTNYKYKIINVSNMKYDIPDGTP